jgi:circadian clock protein KaiC
MTERVRSELALGDRAPTGIEGLDNILGGGLPKDHLYLVEGESGSGKTTLGLQFLLEGRRRGERGLWITMAETAKDLGQAARSHGWSLEGIAVCNLGVSQEALKPGEKYSFFSPAARCRSAP